MLKPWRSKSIGWLTNFFVILLVILTLLKWTAAAKSNGFLRNDYSQEQASRNYYPAGYKRFRRGYGSRDETEFGQFPSYGNSGSSDSFGTFRKGNVGARKGSTRSFNNRGFPAFGGPDAFLSAANPEEEEEDSRGTSINFGASSGGFPSFGSSSSSWGKQTSTKGRSKGGGVKSSAAAKLPPPASINFGGESPRYGGGINSQFLFGGNGGKPNFGASAGSPSFSGTSNFGGQKPFFGNFGNSNQGGRNSFPPSSSSKKTFSSSGGDGFPNPFPNPVGGSGTPFGNLGNLGTFNGKIEDLTGGKVVGPISNFHDLGTLDLNNFLDQLEPSTTTKKPFRKVSEEDRNKVFSGGDDDEYDDESDSFKIPLAFKEKEVNLGFPNPFARPLEKEDKKETKSCDDHPEAPLNAALRCTTYSGCRLDCNSNYRTPDGETRLYLKCKDGEWNIRGKDTTRIPDCEPVCDPPCQNEGICLAPNLCNCPDDWEGPTCEKSKEEKKCTNKPPTPLNTRIFCGKEECVARCIEGYDFGEGLTKLSFVCQRGDWIMRSPEVDKIPDCKPICDPECQNGGICLAPNICECSSEFRGPQCQYPISNCDPKNLGFNGGYNCTGEDMDFGCKLWCPEGISFNVPEASFYRCDYATTKWSPQPIPQCDYSFLFSTPTPYDHSEVIDYLTMPKPKGGTCFAWSGAHFKTFDGKVYSFESGCPYTLLQDASLGTFSVNLASEEGCRGSKCPKTLKIFTEGDQYLLGSADDQPILTFRDTSLAIPGQMNGIVSERVAHFVVVKLTGIGLTIKWDLKNLFIAEVSELLWNRTSGLCGRLDGMEDNDWGYSDGSSEASLNTFLKAWQATTVGAPCLEPLVTRESCSRSSAYKGNNFCSQLATDPRFEPCREVVDVTPYIAACKWDFCNCENIRSPETCSCDSFAAFFRECTNKGGAVQGGWRSEELCPLKCEAGLEYKSCMPAIQPRCGQAADTAKPEFCVEGCDCPAGFVLDANEQCILPESCPCTYHNKTYYSGDTIPNDCNSCTCLSGEWVCTEVKCGSRCSIVGDPHYTTFDGRKFDFMGKCSYYLVKGGDFSIEAENTPCAGAISEAMNFPSSVVYQFPSCTKSLTLRVPGTMVALKQGRAITINGEEVTELPLWANGVFVKRASSLFVMVYLPNGIEVWWDGQTRAYVDAPADLRGLTGGLCGTFNDNQKDDFLTPEGDNEQNPIAFANKWKTSQKCSDMPLSEDAHPCDRHAQNKDLSEKYCSKLKSKLFAKCHLEVDPEQFYRDCIYDLCSCEAELSRCLCPVIAAYGKECARKGVLVDWRAKIRECGMHCSGGQKYQICGDSCSHTCFDLASNPDCKRKCVEGCNCPEGFSLDAHEECVPISQCPCMYEGQEFKPNYEMFQKGLDGSLKLCKCERAAWKCRDPTDVEMASPEFFTEPQVECLSERHEVYTGCMPEEEPNCLTMHLRPEKQADLCRPGCRCDHGYVRDQDTNRCVPYAQCPCHHGGRSYHEGDAIVEECNTCTCDSGVWACTENPCPATCTAWGDSHYKTFDGRMFDFHGTCDYMLAKGKKSRSDVFEVSIQNVPCGTNGVTCAKSLTLRVGSGEDQEVVQFSRNKPTPTKNLTRTIIREAGIFVFAEVADMGLELQWDKGTRAYVTLDPSWKGKSVKGLCGNYNGDENDDFRTPSGGTGEASAKIFGDSWRLQNYCPESILIKDTCALHPHRKVWASEKCATLKSSVFAACHSEVPVDPYIERCQFDSCGCDTGGDCHCLCTAIAAYAHECNIHGVYTRWRRPDFCPMQCDESCEHYEPCIPTCPQETCDSFKEPQSTLCRQDSCVEGCANDVCPPGQVHKSATDHECVPKIDCENKCLEIDGEVYMEGDIVSEDQCHSCFCSKGKKMCQGTPCETTTPFLIESTTDYSYRVTTPSLDLDTLPVDEKEGCRTGWTIWLNQDHPIIFKKNSDIESIPEKVSETLPDRGHCSRSMYDDIRCRTVGEHRNTDSGVTCNLEEGLRCERPKGAAKGMKACPDFEISLYCDCSKETTSPVHMTTPVTPTEPPPVVQPSTTPSTPDIPETCEQEGWTPWMNVHFPTKFGEFETLATIRESENLCPDHYIMEVECRPVGGGALDPASSCDKKGAVCRNNGGLEYCRDYEIRAFCECRCQSGLGMENGQIPDSKITTSSGSPGSTGRLNSFAEWIPELRPGEELSDNWIQIDLEDQKEVTGVLTQGHSSINAYVSAFAVQVSETGNMWEEIRDPDMDYAKRFSGNYNSFEVVENLFPKPVYVRYVRIIPLEMHSIPALRVELKGCNLTDPLVVPEGKTVPPGYSTSLSPLVELTTPLQPTCQDGWTQWMNSHTPSPGDWNDLENYKSLRLKYSFCDEVSIQRVECRVSTIRTSLADSGQVDVVCNKNYGLQCVDELQKEHCYDYEIRFFCDCSLTTPTSIPEPTTPGEVEKPEGVCVPDSSKPTRPHEKDCSKFYECQPMWSGQGKLIEKDCGPGTMYNPKTFVCDWPYVVENIRPECKEKPETTTIIMEPPCSDDFWTEWFNISHPDVDNGDFELIENIRQAGLEICDQVHILDIQCQFTQNTPSKSYGKGSSKGRKFSKGRPKPDRYTSIVADVSRSRDIGVTCTAEEGLVCRNNRQRGRNKCQDYSIRVLCSCEAKKTTPSQTTPSTWSPTTPSEAYTNYTDVRTATPTTSPIMYNDYACPPGKRYEEFAIKCTRVCIFYKHFLAQQGKCLSDHELAPACVDENTGFACPSDFFLRDNSTCVSVANCNCMLPNGMSASPDRTFLVSDCEICRCSNNEMECDNSKCYDKPKEFECDEWSPWLSVSTPSGQGDMETLEILQRYHPDVCSEPEEIECREKESGKPHFLTGQKVICNRNTGFQCLNYKNPGGCKDYEVRIFCQCEDRHETKPVLTTIPPKKYYTTTPLPPLPGCDEPFWTEWFNVTHPRIKGGDYELIDVIIKNGLDICPKPYISKIECAFYKEVKTYESKSRKGNRRFTKGRPARLSTSTYELTDYTESDDMYVTCSKFSGLTCVNSLQAKSKKCQDYAIRAYCECEKDDGFDPKEEVTPAGIPSTTPYPGWPVIGETCEEPEKVRVECAIGCDMLCKFYQHYLKMSGQCASDSDCAPACMELHEYSPCPEGLFMADNSTCVQKADCNCRLPDGRSLPGGVKMQVSECEWCECSDNELLCETTKGCLEGPTEPVIETSSIPSIEVTEAVTTSTTVITTPAPMSLIKIRCNEWTPWMNMKRTSEGDSQRIVDLRAQYEELCEKPINISCRDAIAKLPAEQLDQVITCSTTEGLICRNEDNREDCYDYEVSLFCECDETHTDKVPDSTSTLAPSVTTELVPCDAFSPWINQHKPWLEDGDTEFQTLEQLQLTHNFCLEGHISDIECLEAASGRDISVNKGVRCDRKFGLRCKNSEQDSGVCYDFKIRYFCSCGTTVATRPTLLVPTTLTPPSVCDPNSYIDLLEFVDDSAFSATSSQSSAYGPASARLNEPTSYDASWIARNSDKNQYLQVNLGDTRTVYGVKIAGSPRSGNRVTSFSLMISDDGLAWAEVSPPVLRGPATNSEEKLVLLPGPVEARYVRFVPRTWAGVIAMRVEVIGCSVPTPTPVPTTPKPPICDDDMGFQNGEFSDSQISVSSVYNDMDSVYGKHNVRLNSVAIPGDNAGAWIPKTSPDEFVRFDFLTPSKLTGVVTQGRDGSNEFVETFVVRYSPDGKTWSTVTDSKTGKDKIFEGNYDGSTPVQNNFDRVIEARYLEIRPKTWNENIALRVEVKGCFHPYPEVLTTVAPTTPTSKPPPPYCNACPNLPTDYYKRCYPCQDNQVFDGERCVNALLCPCFHEGIRYPLGSTFETKDCEKCECEGNGKKRCEPKKCDPCSEETERPVLTPTCGCVCKPCPDNSRLCKSNDFCLDEEKWCDGVEHCPDDETSCPTLAPPECPIPECPEDWSPPVLKVKGDDVNCPIYTCEPPDLTTPMSCPPPLCPFGYNIVLVPRKSYEACPRYECEAPPTTLEPYTCPPPTCPNGYDIEIVPESYDQFAQSFGNYDQESYDLEDGCKQYKCVTNAPPTAPCPPPNCPQGYDVSYPVLDEMFSLCPTYECVPIITTTPCPPVECPEGLQTLVIQSDGELCPQFTCIKVTTQPGFTTPALTEMPCREVALPVCEPGEEIYQSNPQNPCPIFKCKKIGAPPPTTEPPKLVRPTCEVKNKDFTTFDGSEFRFEICHHILARDKVSKDWEISLHQTCSDGPCSRSLMITEGKHNLKLGHDLSISWDGHNYSVPQAHKIGESTELFSISKVGDAIIFMSKTHNYDVIWNVDNDVKIKVKDEAAYQVDGLCGLFSGSPMDDWAKPDGSSSVSTKEFGDSWALSDEAPCEQPPKKCSPEENKKAFILCNALDSKPFTECHDVLPVASYLKGCVDRLCVCLKENRTEEECKCGVLASYITACLEKKPDAKVADWRIVTKCYKECPAGEVYNDCFKTSCEKSCETLKDPDMCSEKSDAPCISGCFCEPGLVRKGEACVLPETCRDCICEGYGDPHYKSFDRKNFTFNGECSYVATRDVDPKGEHKFQVITRNKRCRRDPITMCTESVKVLYDSNEIEVLLLPSDKLVTTINGDEIVDFPMRKSWIAIERPDEDHVMLAIPELQLEVTYSKDNYGFNVRVPSHLFSGKLEGLCGNCNFDPEDDLQSKGGSLVSSVNDFGRSWLVDVEDGSTCQVFTKEEEPCTLRHPDEDPCLKLMDQERFGECHPLEDPVAYVSSCQLDLCLSDEPEKSACQSLEAYARRCAQLDVCLTWRDAELCPKKCPEGLEYMSCGPGCVKTCDNYKELKKDPKYCPISPLDGCYCPGSMILDDNTCVNESRCLTCDSEGHRVGDTWKTDNCTTCECGQDGVSTCRTKSCPIDPICNEGFIIEEIPGTDDECCGPQKTCKIKPKDNCTEPFKPGQSCGYGKLWKLMEYPGLCPQYVCVCLEPEDCPDVVIPSDDELKPGEEWTFDNKGCCPHYVSNCTGECPQPECQEFYEPDIKPQLVGECCPKYTCEPPSDACIHEPHVVVENGFERPLKDAEIPEKSLYKVGEKWMEGLCIECECSLDTNKKPVSKCLKKTCPKKEEHRDRKDYVLKEERVPNTCCSKITRTACLDDGEVFSANQSIYDSLNACRSVECKPNREGSLEKVEQIFSCDEACPLGWEYQPSPLAPMVCCGGCVQIACDHNGELKKVGEVWYSPDYCTVFECINDKSDKIQSRSKEIQCSVPSEEEKAKYSFSEKKHDKECCLTYTREQCLIDGKPIPAGQEVTDPNDKCIRILCESSADGNVTRKEKERSCVRNCPLGHVYMEPPSDSEECCGTCFQTQCVHDDKIHLIGDTWENPKDICYQYTCQMRDDDLTVVAIKRECPYFDPECPPSETLRDPTGCCRICNITRETKRECQPEEIDPKDTLDMFVLEARTVGRCTNPRPVYGFKKCSGQCDSKTVFRAQGIDARHVSECDCCRPSKLSQIEVVLQCNRGYSFQRVYDNIEACECQPCESGQRDDPYVNDQPLEDLTQFNIPLPNADEPLQS